MMNRKNEPEKGGVLSLPEALCLLIVIGAATYSYTLAGALFGAMLLALWMWPTA